jgi:hypothetical protein
MGVTRPVARSVVRPVARSVVAGVVAGSVLLLDAFPGATVAYSLRKLRSAYTGSAIRVRRSSDNAEQDIGFSGNDFDTAALTSFVGAGDGFVTTWYDQTTSGLNGTQATSGNQPLIVESGVVRGGVKVIANGTRRIDFNLSTLQSLPVSIFDITNLLALNTNAFSNAGFLIGGPATGFQGRYEIRVNTSDYAAQRKIVSGVNTLTLAASAFQKNAIAAIFGSTEINGIQNGTSYGPASYSGTAFNTAGNFRYGSDNSSFVSLTAEKSELLIYLTDQTSNAAAIHANQRAYWGTV